MTGTFACPECGDEVTLQGATPGREVQCAQCGTWVEVPYLPRDGVWTRPRFRKSRPAWVIPLAWAGVGLLAVVVAVMAGGKYVASRGVAAREASLAEFLRAADAAERSGLPGHAISEVEAALALIGPAEPTGSRRLAALRRRRDALSVREAEARMAASSGLDPLAAVGALLSIQARARGDRALDPLAATIRLALDEARRRQVAADLASARRSGDSGRPFEVLAMADRALTVADKLGTADLDAARSEAEGLVAPIVGRIGVIVEARPGQFTLGSISAYDVAIGARLVDALRRQGYVPKPGKGPTRAFWDRHALYRLSYQVVETQDARYLQSPNRLSEITASLMLTKGRETPWQDRMTGRTQVPLPALPAYLAGRIAIAERRDPETERRLYDSARSQLLEQVDLKTRGIPTP